MAAICWYWSKSQSRAAPMPRSGSVCDDRVCRVPKATRRRTVASIRAGSTAARMARSSASGAWAVGGGPAGKSPAAPAAAAGAAPTTVPAAATPVAATAAERKVRRDGSGEPEVGVMATSYA